MSSLRPYDTDGVWIRCASCSTVFIDGDLDSCPFDLINGEFACDHCTDGRAARKWQRRRAAERRREALNCGAPRLRRKRSPARETPFPHRQTKGAAS